jgi:hypothetical protein
MRTIPSFNKKVKNFFTNNLIIFTVRQWRTLAIHPLFVALKRLASGEVVTLAIVSAD